MCATGKLYYIDRRRVQPVNVAVVGVTRVCKLTDPRRESKANDSLSYAGHRHRSVIDWQSDFGSQPD